MGNEINIELTSVHARNWYALTELPHRFIKNEGGSRSSKTFSICQAIIRYCLTHEDKVWSVIRKHRATLTGSGMKDFFEVLKYMNLYKKSNHNMTHSEYQFDTGCVVEFYGADDEQKLRGRKRDFAWLNEANELLKEDFRQINARTTEKILIDYNPSALESYLYELPDERTITIHSTYKDNPFLSEQQIIEIEDTQFTDPDYYTVFGLGKRAFTRENVFVEWKVLKEKPHTFTEFIYGLDFGFNHPTALVKVWFNRFKKELYLEELIYETNLTSNDIVNKMNKLGVDKNAIIVAETARPEIVKDIRGAGYQVVNAIKDVKDGINNLRTFMVYLSPDAPNLKKENMNYRYVKKNGNITEEVIKLWDDGMDATRYAAMYIKKYLLQLDNIQSNQVFSFNI